MLPGNDIIQTHDWRKRETKNTPNQDTCPDCLSPTSAPCHVSSLTIGHHRLSHGGFIQSGEMCWRKRSWSPSSRVRIRHVRGRCWHWVVDHRNQVRQARTKERHGSARFQGSREATATGSLPQKDPETISWASF